jgi:CRISPR-associated protein Csb2
VTGHTRHYMPTGNQTTTKIFDAFARIEPEDPLIAYWPTVTLSLESHSFLTALVKRMGYLGRAETWVEAEVVEAVPQGLTARPINDGTPASSEEEVVTLLSLTPQASFEAWRKKWLVEQENLKLARGKAGKLSTKERAALMESVPETVWQCLEFETADLQKAGWSQPPGTRWVSYTRPKNIFKTITPGKAAPMRQTPTVARFTVASNVLPPLTEAVTVAERIRQRLMALSRDASETPASVFSGHTANGEDLPQGHKHAHYLCEANGKRQSITHVTVWAPGGFEPLAQQALRSLRKVWGTGDHDIQLVLEGFGDAPVFGGCLTENGQAPLMAEAVTWVSRTPFILPRHPKQRRDGSPKLNERGEQIDGPEAQLRSEFSRRGFPPVVSVERIAHTIMAGQPFRWLSFRRERLRGGGAKGSQQGYGFRVVFSQPVRGPISVGYGSHFGLGLFVPEVQ